MRKLNQKKYLISNWRLPLLSACAVLCSVSPAAMAKVVASDSGCPAWNPNFTYATNYYPVEYQGQVYVNHWYTSGDVPDATNSGNPWHYPDAGQDPATLCKNIPAPGAASIEAWSTAAKYNSGASVPLIWDMYSGNTSANWQILDNDVSIYKANTVSSTGVSTSLKLADGQHVLKVKLCSTDSDASCSVSAPITVTVGGGNPPPPTLPTPIIDAPVDGSKTTNPQIPVSWHPNSSGSVPANSYWNVETTNSAGTSVFTNNITQFSSTNNTTVKVDSTGDYILQVNVCQDVNTCKFSSVTIHVDSPAVTPATPTITQPTGGTVNNPVTLTWNAKPDNANDNLWEVLDNANTTPIYTSKTLTINARGENGTGSLTLTAGNHSLQVALCNDAGCGALSNAVNVSIPNPPPTDHKIIMGYYSNWTTYNPMLRHGAPSIVDSAHQTIYPPYGLSQTMYQYPNDTTGYNHTPQMHNMDTNNDSQAQILKLDIIAYAFGEVYPSYSVQYDSSTKTWVPFGASVHPSDPNGAYFAANNVGKIFLSDPWSDLSSSTTWHFGGIADDQGYCKQSNVFNSGNSDIAKYAHVICLGGYETVVSGKTGQPTEYTTYTIPSVGNIESGAPMTQTTFNANAGYWNFGGNLDQFSKLTNSSGLKKVISIGGWYHEDSFEAGAFVNHANFIGSLEQVLDNFNLDGVDLDYEPGFYNTDGYTDANAANFVSLVVDLRTALDAKYGVGKKLITMAISANPDTLNIIGKDRWTTLAQNVDYVSLMGYDFHGAFDAQGSSNGKATTDFHSNLLQDPKEPQTVEGGHFNADQSIQLLIKTMGVPSQKILLGVPSYGRAVEDVESSNNNGLYQTYDSSSFLGDMDSPTDSRHLPQGQQSYYGMVHDETVMSTGSNGQVSYVTYNNWLQHGFNTGAVSTTDGDYAAWVFNNSYLDPNYYNAKTGQFGPHQTAAFASYDTPAVIKTKANYVNQQQLGGMMMWELSSDTPPTETDTSLLCAMASILHSGSGNASCSSTAK